MTDEKLSGHGTVRAAARWGMLAGFLLMAFGVAARFAGSQVWYKSLPVVIPLGAGLALILAGVALNFRWLGAGLLRRKTAVILNVAAMTLLAAIVLVLSNLILSRHYARFDLTEKGLFTLSDQTKELLSKLPAKVTVTALFSMTPQLRQIEDRIGDLLRQYASQSAMVDFREINVDKPQDAGKAREFIASMKTPPPRDSIIFQCREETRTLSWESMITVEDGEGKFKGEQALTTALKAVEMEKKHVVYFTVGHGERDVKSTLPDVGYVGLGQALDAENYTIQQLILSSAKIVPDDCSALVIAGPTRPFSEEELKAIDSYLEDNGGLIVMFDPEVGGGSSAGLKELLAKFHITVRDDLLARQIFGIGGGAAVVTSDLFGSKYTQHPVIKDVPSFTSKFPASCVLDVTPPERMDAESPFLLAGKLVESDPPAWGEKRPQDRTKGTRFDTGEDVMGPLAFVVISQVVAPTGDRQRPVKEAEGPRIVAISTSLIAANAYLVNPIGNRQLMMNAISWVDQKGLPPATIPAQSADMRPMPKLQDPRISRTIFLVTVLAMPLLAILFGGFVWFMRRK